MEEAEKLIRDEFTYLFPNQPINTSCEDDEEIWTAVIGELTFVCQVGSDDEGFYFTEVNRRHKPVVIV